MRILSAFPWLCAGSYAGWFYLFGPDPWVALYVPGLVALGMVLGWLLGWFVTALAESLD